MILIIATVVVGLFAFVLLFGAPYLPTRQAQTNAALDLLKLKPGEVLYELGCGDGRVLKEAAKRGVYGVGYELNPLVALVAKINTWKYRDQVKIVWGNFWKADLSKADGVYVFLLDKFMNRLDQKVSSEVNKQVKLASFAFKIPGKKVSKIKNGIYLYEY